MPKISEKRKRNVSMIIFDFFHDKYYSQSKFEDPPDTWTDEEKAEYDRACEEENELFKKIIEALTS
ncbi:MAG: hypothetical protein AAF388_01915 [Bacteroidota bacterium]